jgi:hypothetical protein
LCAPIRRSGQRGGTSTCMNQATLCDDHQVFFVAACGQIRMAANSRIDHHARGSGFISPSPGKEGGSAVPSSAVPVGLFESGSFRRFQHVRRSALKPEHYSSAARRPRFRAVSGEPAVTSATRHPVPPPDRRRVISVVHLGRPVARGSGGGRNTEVLPLGPVPEEDPDRLPAGRAVRLGAVRHAAEGRGSVAGQECQCHRHLLDIEQSQPIKPVSPYSVGLVPELINGQRTFHTKILSAGALAATTDAPPPPACRDQSAAELPSSRNHSATNLQPNDYSM